MHKSPHQSYGSPFYTFIASLMEGGREGEIGREGERGRDYIDRDGEGDYMVIVQTHCGW